MAWGRMHGYPVSWDTGCPIMRISGITLGNVIFHKVSKVIAYRLSRGWSIMRNRPPNLWNTPYDVPWIPRAVARDHPSGRQCESLNEHSHGEPEFCVDYGCAREGIPLIAQLNLSHGHE